MWYIVCRRLSLPRTSIMEISVLLWQAKVFTKPTAKQLREVIIEITQRQNCPILKLQGNAGSFFMNPIVEKAKYEELAALYPGMPHYTIDAFS